MSRYCGVFINLATNYFHNQLYYSYKSVVEDLRTWLFDEFETEFWEPWMNLFIHDPTSTYIVKIKN